MNGRTRRLQISLVVALVLALPTGSTRGVAERSLTFEERVKAQEALARVYYSHQIGASKPFAEAVSQAYLEHQVHTYLKQSVALDRFWHTTITAEMLRGETERMLRETRMPERLRELRAALGNDPELIQECLVRPRLVDRLARGFFAYDPNIHNGQRQSIGTLRDQLVGGVIHPWSSNRYRRMSHLLRGGPEAGREPAARADMGRRSEREHGIVMERDAFDRLRARLPQRAGEIGPVEEDRGSFGIPVVLDESESEMRVATYSLPKVEWDTWWRSVEGSLDEGLAQGVTAAETSSKSGIPETSCPVDDSWDNGSLGVYPREGHTAVWTGSLMLVWGGLSQYSGGSRYDPATDTWTPISMTNAPSDRSYHTAIWTGSLMVIWGGSGGRYLSTGGRYDPSTDTWTPTSLLNAPLSRRNHAAVWTGTRMVVWCGASDLSSAAPFQNTGGQYDPVTDRWTATSTVNAPSGREQASATWTGSVMLVWGGYDGRLVVNTGGRYDPVTDAWTSMSTTDSPAPGAGIPVVWTGAEMVVWGSGPHWATNPGARYDPSNDSWQPMSLIDAPAFRYGHTTVWNGSEMIVWGGISDGSLVNTGSRYDPVADSWTATSTTNAPGPRFRHTAVWTGEVMVVWGGSAFGPLNTGGRYDPTSDSWTPTSGTEVLSPRWLHASVWTGNEMIVWGGEDRSGQDVNTGGRYDPATDTWVPTATLGAPAPRRFHTAIWTGQEMIVWGGSGPGSIFDSGGRYDPMSDTWSDTSLVSAPDPRIFHTAVWTGKEMIVWGGVGSYPKFDTGGRYDPIKDTWSETSMEGAPTPRAVHTAVWTGREMLVWGGVNDDGTRLGTGGRYDPSADTWAPISPNGAAAPRSTHTAV